MIIHLRKCQALSMLNSGRRRLTITTSRISSILPYFPLPQKQLENPNSTCVTPLLLPSPPHQQLEHLYAQYTSHPSYLLPSLPTTRIRPLSIYITHPRPH